LWRKTAFVETGRDLYNIGMERSGLHALVESLPEGALERASRILQHLQVWPPAPSPEMERMRQINQERRMRRLMNPGTIGKLGTIGGYGGGGSFNPMTGYGHSAHTGWEDDETVVHETRHFFKGHEIVVAERLRLGDDRKAIEYQLDVKGPLGDSVRNEARLQL
jgi:hypothetical protein